MAEKKDLSIKNLTADFHKVEYYEIHKKIENPNLNIKYLKDLVTKISLGNTGKIMDGYVDNGVPYLTTKNITENGVDFSRLTFITKEIHNNKLKNSKVYPKDILYNKSGNVGLSAIIPNDYEEYNLVSDLIYIRPIEEKVDPNYLVLYLNSSVGKKLSEQQAGGAIFQHISIYDVGDLRVSIPSKSIQTYIGNKARKAEQLKAESKQLKAEAQKILSRASAEEDLLKIFRGNDTLVTWTDQGIIQTRRLDADFYKEKYVNFDEYIYQNKDNFIKLKDIASLSKQRADLSKYGEKFLYLDISSLNEDTGIFEKNEIFINEAPSRAQKLVLLDEILVSTVRPNRKGIGIVTQEFDQQVASTGFAILQPKVNSYFLLSLLRSDFVTNQLIRITSGGLYPAIGEEELMEIYVPIIAKDIMIQIGEKMKLYFSNLEKSKTLLLEAKQDVESLIEGKFDERKVAEIK